MPDTVGVVLGGGRSSRFGSDKFLHPVDGVEMGLRAVRCLTPVVECVLVVGRDHVPDDCNAEALFGAREGSGPLGAILDAAEHTGATRMIVVPCDMPWLTSASVTTLRDAFDPEHHAVAFAHHANHDEPQWLTGCWDGNAVREEVRELYEHGERSVRQVARHLRHVLVAIPADELINVNEPVQT